MRDYIDISDEQIVFLQSYPYPWSFLGKKRNTFKLPKWMNTEKYTLFSLRVAESCIDANIRDSIVYPLFLTSANLSGMRESSTLLSAESIFPGISGIDGGVCDRPPSDILSIDEEGGVYYLRKNY